VQWLVDWPDENVWAASTIESASQRLAAYNAEHAEKVHT
jgi:hypothetical protein